MQGSVGKYLGTEKDLGVCRFEYESECSVMTVKRLFGLSRVKYGFRRVVPLPQDAGIDLQP